MLNESLDEYLLSVKHAQHAGRDKTGGGEGLGERHAGSYRLGVGETDVMMYS